MSGRNKDITKHWFRGELQARCWGAPDFNISGVEYRLTCHGCWECRTEGLGGGPGMTEADICVGAQVDGWKLTSSEQFCPKCWRKARHKVGSVLFGYFEWWARTMPFPVSVNIAIGSLTFATILWLIARTSAYITIS